MIAQMCYKLIGVLDGEFLGGASVLRLQFLGFLVLSDMFADLILGEQKSLCY